MKTLILFSALNVIAVAVFAQQSITIKGKTIGGSEAGEEIWVFQDAQDTVIAMKFTEYKALNRKIEELMAREKRLNSIIQAKNELIAAFENYEDKVEVHIATHTELINTADSLYLGYKDLYNDLKSIYGINTVSLLLGAGGFRHNPTAWKPLGSVGVTYKRFQGSFQFGIGEQYKGFNLQYSIPLF